MKVEHKKSPAGNVMFRIEAEFDHPMLTVARVFSNEAIKKKCDPMINEFKYRRLGTNFFEVYNSMHSHLIMSPRDLWTKTIFNIMPNGAL